MSECIRGALRNVYFILYYTQPWMPFCSAATQNGKGIERLI